MNILIIGSGGREHALAWKIKQSPLTTKLWIAPGNAGTAGVGENIPLSGENFEGLAKVCLEKEVELVVVGPEGPLVKGIRDYFESRNELKHILLVGPGSLGAQLEGSKDFSKRFMMRHGIPTAQARTFSADDLEDGLHYLATCPTPIVLKADGLAAGKGVIICSTRKEAQENLKDMLANKRFGSASEQVLVEEFLEGIELSVFVLTDGKDFVLLPEAKDYKRIGESDTGPNTGGMGAVSPVAFADAAFMKEVTEKIIKPTIHGLKDEHIPYRGFIFFGLIKTAKGPYVIEYNARMGDPETEAVMTRIDSDFVELLVACAKGELKGKTMNFDAAYAVTVMMVAGGYPGEYKKGDVISGLPSLGSGQPPFLTFHAGTRSARESGGQQLQAESGRSGPLWRTVTDGGRVMAVTGKGRNLAEARKNAFEGVGGISWPGVYFRKDIGVDLMQIESSRGDHIKI